MAAGDLALRIIITASGSQAMAEIGMIATEANRVASGIGMAGILAAAGLIAVGVASTKIAGDFEQQMNHMHALAGVNVADTKMISNALLEMAPAVAQGPVELAKAMFQATSALYKAQPALEIVHYSAIMASTGMADVVEVTKAMIVVMKNYGMDAKTAADEVTAAVSLGRMTMTDYANSIGVVVQKGKQANASFLEINAAMDVLTSTVFPSAQQAARNLGQMFTQVGINVDALAKRAKGMGLTFEENYYKSLPLIDKLEYLKKITGGNSEELNKLIGGGVYASRVVQALTSNVGMYDEILKRLKTSTQGQGAAWDAWQKSLGGFNVQMGMASASIQVLGIIIGTKLFPFITPLVQDFAQAALNVASWLQEEKPLNDILSLTGKYTQQVLPWLAGLATTIMILLVPAVISLVTSMSPLILWSLAIGAAVAGLVAGFIYLYQHSVAFRTIIDEIVKVAKNLAQAFMTNVWPALVQFWGVLQNQVIPAVQHFFSFIDTNFLPACKAIGDWIRTYVWPVLQQLGQYLATQFKPVWDQLVQTWNSQLLPSLKQLWSALQPLLPVLMTIGGAILGVVVLALMFLIMVISMTIVFLGALLTGIIQMVAGIAAGLATFIGGVVQFVTGIVQIVSGILQFLYDLITMNWQKIGSDLGLIWQGIINLVEGWVTAFIGFIQMLVGAVVGLIGGFVGSIVAFFQHLYDQVVGHSIIPDMVNGILSWISGLPGKALTFFTTMGNNITKTLGNLATQGIAKITSFVTDMGNKFAKAASDALNWGANIVHSILQGLQNAWGAVTSWLSGALANIKNMFPHSPVKEGPLVGLENWGGNIVDNLVTSMHKSAPKLLLAARDLAASANEPFSTLNGFAVNGGSFALHSGNTIIIQPSQAAPVQLDKRQVGEILFSYQASEMRKQGVIRNK